VAATLLSFPAAATAATTLPNGHLDGSPPPAYAGMSQAVTVSANLVLSYQGTQHSVALAGPGTMVLGTPTTVDGRPAVPLLISYGPLTGNDPDLGAVNVTTEGPQDAWLMENSATNPYPAQVVLPVNDHITIGALPGVTLFVEDMNNGPALLLSSNITSGAPQSTMYSLAGPANLADLKDGTVLATAQDLQVTMKRS
jgi:hypothetical protein